MSATVSTDIFCDNCPDWIHGVTGPRQDMDKARAVAAAVGWTRHRLGRGRLVDLCPDCTKERGVTS